jgi:chromatin remodeling complex protein RSC6
MQQPNEATTEQRERAARYWEEVVRPELTAKEATPKAKETPEQALARLKAEGWGSVQISPALTKILGIKKSEQAA